MPPIEPEIIETCQKVTVPPSSLIFFIFSLFLPFVALENIVTIHKKLYLLVCNSLIIIFK